MGFKRESLMEHIAWVVFVLMMVFLCLGLCGIVSID